MEDIYKKYIEYICKVCKAEECTKGICRLQSDVLEIKCVDFVKDESKIKPIQPELRVTAKKSRAFDRLYM